MAIQTDKSTLGISNSRFCDCPINHINCLTAKEWILSQIGVWKFSYESRDIRDKNIHPATFPISLPKKCIELFTHEGELVLDPFAGSGSTLIAAQDSNRNCVGLDLKAEYISVCQNRLSTQEQESQQIALCEDARNADRHLSENSISLIVTSPPYANLLNRPRRNKSRRGELRQNNQYLKIEQYSQDENDLGTLTLDQYQSAMTEIFRGLLPLLKEKAHCVVNVPDVWMDNKRMTIHISVVKALTEAGYELRNTIIWDRTNIVNRIGIFGWPSNYITMGTTFEYILDFWRPPSES
tara:strand:+ start:11013 stop:11897 length:885 start_codon:yes stop_codon:yes gene_type:complete